jgi:hypothetical protein
MVWVGAKPGAVFSLYVVSYAVWRFFIEFARGDAERAYLWDFSEAQWTSGLLLWAVAFAERRSALPAARWHLLAAVILSSCMAFLAIVRRCDPVKRFQLRHAYHIRDLACAIRNLSARRSRGETISRASGSSRSIAMFTTCRGITLSGGTIDAGGSIRQNYCFSRPQNPLTLQQAGVLGRTIAQIQVPPRTLRLHTNSPGIFHLLTDGQEAESGGPARQFSTKAFA